MSSGIELASGLLDDFTEAKVKELLEVRPWMRDKKFLLLTNQIEIEKYIDKCIENGIAVCDLETTSLNTRLDREGKPIAKIVGVCLSCDPNEGVYIPVAHEDAAEFNVSLKFVLRELSRLSSNCVLIFHNFKYDGQVLRNHGIIIDREDMYEDTYLMAAVEDSSRKQKGLKYLSEALLNRPQLEISDMGIQGNKKNVVAFEMVPPQKAVYYGAGDGMNTMALYLELKNRIDKQDPTKLSGPWTIYKIEKRCLFVTMEMERNLSKVDREYLIKTTEDVEKRMDKIVKEIFFIAKHEFDINSTQQLGVILFDELKLPYPARAEKTKTGHYQTNNEVLEQVKTKNPIIDLILTYRGYVKIRGTYLKNFLANVDENDEVKFQLNQVQADTGRYSGSGGKGFYVDGYCGVNCQNIPKYNSKDPHSINLRRAIIAHPGYKIVSIDYSGEELRIATNFSQEPKWIHEFLQGTGDLHTITGQIITGKKEISKEERSSGKTLNFLTLYGGGAGGFAQEAKIPYETAKKMIINFFREYKGLNSWIKKECVISRKRGYSRTAFGRRRPLGEYFNSPDKKIQAQGDRLTINSAVQGCLQPHEKCLTNKGYISIKEICRRKLIGEDFKVWTGNSWETFDVLNRGECQHAVIELENGMELQCDTRHEVLTVGDDGYEFRKFADLNENTAVCVSIPRQLEFGYLPDQKFFSGGAANNSKEIRLQDNEDFEFIAYVLGIVIGDGNVRGVVSDNRPSVTISFGQSKIDEYYEILRRGFEKVGLLLAPYRKTKAAKGISYQATVSSKALVSLFKYYGYENWNAKTKRVPQKIFECPLFMRKAFLKGCFHSDGCRKPNNRYSIHTANLRLLKDIQLLGWTVGLASFVKTHSDGSHILCWSDLSEFERTLELTIIDRRRRTGGTMLLPGFLHKEMYNSLKNDGRYNKDNNDRALVCKLNKHNKVLVQTAVKLLDKYECPLPVMYYHYKVKQKKTLDTKTDTYTLSVHSDLHRFDSAGIISKNTGADVIKIALWKVYRWIKENDLQDDVKIMLPVHDEIVFEVKEDKLDAIIPELCRIMKIREVTDKLNWKVPFEVDAEYGDSFYVDHDYWKEYNAKLKEDSEPSSSVQDLSIKAPVLVIEPQKKTEKEEEKKVMSLEDSAIVEENPNLITFNATQGYYRNITVKSMLTNGIEVSKDAQDVLSKTEEKIGEPLYKDARIYDRIDEKGFFNYPIDIDPVSARILRFIFETLRAGGDRLFIGPKNKVCIISKEGEIYYKSSEEVSIDAFLALCMTFNI